MKDIFDIESLDLKTLRDKLKNVQSALDGYDGEDDSLVQTLVAAEQMYMTRIKDLQEVDAQKKDKGDLGRAINLTVDPLSEQEDNDNRPQRRK